MTLTDVLVTEAESTYDITGRLFRRLSDDDLAWSPPMGATWMTVGQLLMHCAAFGCGMAIRGFVTGDWESLIEATTEHDQGLPPGALPSVKTVQEALDRLAADRDLALGWIRSAGEASLLSRELAAPWGGPPLPLFQQLLRMIAHLAQHKGQLFYYLKLMGRDVGTSDLWGA